MLKPFTFEGRFEAGLDACIRERAFAFVAVVGENYPWRLGAAVANDPGYFPVPEFWCHGDDQREFDDHVAALNEKEGLTRRQAALLIVSTMGGRQVGIVREDGRARVAP